VDYVRTQLLQKKSLRLHLGCGQYHLDGYVNIDFPLAEHTLQRTSVADEFHDLTDMRYPVESVDEIRLHHVFEHFPRPQAAALVASWGSWLRRGGSLRIEVPDFDATAALVLNAEAPVGDRRVAIRHIFGSNEAPWATHYDGWSESRLRELFDAFGFDTREIARNAYLATRNLEIIGTRRGTDMTRERAVQAAREYLRPFTLDEGDFETRLLDIWLEQFCDQLDRTLAAS
jgi:predicted SAM-dependent methyltransferase